MDCYFERLGYLFNYLNNQNATLAQLKRSIIQEYILSLKDRVSDETINGRIRVYRKFFNFLITESFWSTENPMKGISLLKTSKRIKPVLSADDLQAVLRGIKTNTFEGNRNLVMILVFWDTMVRLRELLTMKTSDLDLEAGLVKVFGKGRKERMVPMGNRTSKQICKYLIKWRSKYPGDFLFCMRNGEPLEERRCRKIVQETGNKQNIKLYPHLLRHSAATWYANQGGNLAVLQRILGHTSLAVTQNYLHVSVTDMIRSYQNLSPSNQLKL
jgi:site-specific recombinase XerD